VALHHSLNFSASNDTCSVSRHLGGIPRAKLGIRRS